MTPEQEIQRIKKEYAERWSRLENHPTVQWAIANKDPVKLGEIAAMVVYGNYYDRGAATQSRHTVMVLINHDTVGFDSLEAARKYVAFKSKDTPGRPAEIYQQIDGHWEPVS